MKFNLKKPNEADIKIPNDMVQQVNDETVEETFQVQRVTPTVNVQSIFSHTAVSMYKDPLTGRWMVVEIKFDPLTRQTTSLNVVNEEIERAEAEHRFKIHVAQQVFKRGD